MEKARLTPAQCLLLDVARCTGVITDQSQWSYPCPKRNECLRYLQGLQDDPEIIVAWLGGTLDCPYFVWLGKTLNRPSFVPGNEK